jgi:hypothetical protein
MDFLYVESGDKASITNAEGLFVQQSAARLKRNLSRGGDGDTALVLCSIIRMSCMKPLIPDRSELSSGRLTL